MSIIGRFKAAFLAFRNPSIYWEGVTIRKTADEIWLKGRWALLMPEPQL